MSRSQRSRSVRCFTWTVLAQNSYKSRHEEYKLTIQYNTKIIICLAIYQSRFQGPSKWDESGETSAACFYGISMTRVARSNT